MGHHRIGPVAWVIVAVLSGGGIYWYLRQPPERREKISKVAVQAGTHLLNEFERATDGILQVRLQLRASVVPRPEQRTPVSAILRELALSAESLSAQQLAELLSRQTGRWMGCAMGCLVPSRDVGADPAAL